MTIIFEPAAGRHAIENCQVAIQTAAALDPASFADVQAKATQIARANGLLSHQPPMFAPVIFPGVPGNQVPMMAPAIHQRYAPDGQVETELRCESLGLMLQTRIYNGWQDLRERIKNTILALLPTYLANVPAVTAIRMQYDDVFVATSDSNVSTGEVFRQPSTWVVNRDLATDQMWHSTYGVFRQLSEDSRELVNVNVQVSNVVRPHDLQPKRVVSLTFLTGYMHDLPGQSPLFVGPEDSESTMLSVLDRIHDRQKEILREVLSDEYLHAIGC